MKKQTIFISANQKELWAERLAVKAVVNDNPTLRQYFDVFLFEDLPAKGRSPVSTYLKYVGQSDIYVCAIGRDYGDKSSDGLSATERGHKSLRGIEACFRSNENHLAHLGMSLVATAIL